MFSKDRAEKKAEKKAQMKADKQNVAKRKALANAAPSILSTNITVTGDLVCEGEIQVDGTVEGDVKCAKLTVGPTGTIRGSVVADWVSVQGAVNGEIRAVNIHLTRTSRVFGDVLHDSLKIEPGALIEGHCRRVEKSEDSGEPTINLIVDQSRTTA